MENESGDLYYLHVPTSLAGISWSKALVASYSVGRALYKTFAPIADEAQSVLDDLPWEDIPPP